MPESPQCRGLCSRAGKRGEPAADQSQPCVAGWLQLGLQSTAPTALPFIAVSGGEQDALLRGRLAGLVQQDRLDVSLGENPGCLQPHEILVGAVLG